MQQDNGMYAMGSMITKVHKSRCRQYSMSSLDGYAAQRSKAMMAINVMARVICPIPS